MATVLIADDFAMNRESAKNFLRYTDVNVCFAANGEEAVSLASEIKPEIIFLDLIMPKLDGAQACRQIKRNGDSSLIPVVMMLNSSVKEEVSASFSAGCDDVISKPLDRREFLEKGRKYLPQIDRREPRVSCEMKLQFSGEGYQGEGISLDISCGGIYVITDETLPRESMISVNFILPEEGASPLLAQGRVAWINQTAEGKVINPHLPKGFGVEFSELSESARFYVRRFIEMHRR